jgi:hypothetical protein
MSAQADRFSDVPDTGASSEASKGESSAGTSSAASASSAQADLPDSPTALAKNLFKKLGIIEDYREGFVHGKKPEKYQIILPDGVMEMEYFRHNDHAGVIGRYDRVEQVLDAKYMHCGCVHGAKSWLIDAPAMWEASLKALEKEPCYFIDFVRK